jgi:maltooligosyltrehalose trehalohydrolase
VRRPLTLIAESDLNDPRLVTAREGGGYGLQAQWCDDLHHQLHSALTGERQGYYVDFGDLPGLAATLRHAFRHTDTWSTFRERGHGRPVNTHVTPAHRFLVYLQNHDQIGNRATGDRVSATLSPGLLACGAALVLCSPYTPMLFMGEEWGARTPWQFFSHFPDPDLRDAVRNGRTEEFATHGWDSTIDPAAVVPDPNAESTFTDSRLDWSEPEREPHATLLRTYRELIALRRTHPELTDPWLDRLGVNVDEKARTVVLHRRGLRVAVNLGPEAAVVDLRAPVREVLLRSADAAVEGSGLTLPAESFAVVAL